MNTVFPPKASLQCLPPFEFSILFPLFRIAFIRWEKKQKQKKNEKSCTFHFLLFECIYETSVKMKFSSLQLLFNFVCFMAYEQELFCFSQRLAQLFAFNVLVYF